MGKEIILLPSVDREFFKEILEKLEIGDTLDISSFENIFINIPELIEFLDWLKEGNITLKHCTKNISINQLKSILVKCLRKELPFYPTISNISKYFITNNNLKGYKIQV